MTVSISQLVIAGLFLFMFLPLIGYIYGRQRRWLGMIGWWLLVGGQVFLAIGGGELFPWAGLAALFTSAAGLLLVVWDGKGKSGRSGSREP